MHFFQAFGAVMSLSDAFGLIVAELQKAMANGEVSGDEAADIGSAIAMKLGDLRIVVSGQDIFDEAVQVDLCRGLARLARNFLYAKGGIKGIAENIKERTKGRSSGRSRSRK